MSQQKTYTTAELRGLKDVLAEQALIGEAKQIASSIPPRVIQLASGGDIKSYTQNVVMTGSQDQIIRKQGLIESFIRETFPDMSIKFVTVQETSKTIRGVTTLTTQFEVVLDWSN